MCVLILNLVPPVIQLDSAPRNPTLKTFRTPGDCSIKKSDPDVLGRIFREESIFREYGAF